MLRLNALLLCAASLAASGCVAEPGRPPVARITAEPRAIPEHDEFRTDVLLDGTESADPIDDPEGARPLAYRWQIIGDEARFADGDERAAAPLVRLRGASPATVRLTVTDEDGLSSTSRLQLQLTISE